MEFQLKNLPVNIKRLSLEEGQVGDLPSTNCHFPPPPQIPTVWRFWVRHLSWTTVKMHAHPPHSAFLSQRRSKHIQNRCKALCQTIDFLPFLSSYHASKDQQLFECHTWPFQHNSVLNKLRSMQYSRHTKKNEE